MFLASFQPATANLRNLLFMTAMIVFMEGTRAFCGLPARLWWMYPAGVIGVAGASYAERVHDVNGRNIALALPYSLAAALSAIALFSVLPSRATVGSRFTSIMFWLFAAVNLARAVFYLSAPRFPPQIGVADFLLPSSTGRVIYFGILMTILCCSIGWQLMIVERLCLELRERERSAKDLAERVSAANAAKGEFLAFLGHEIRNPLGAVLNLTDLMLDTELTAEQKEFQIGVRTSIEALLRVTEDVLDVHKLESDTLVIEPAPFDIFSLVDNICNVFRPLAQRKGLGLIVEHGKETPQWLIGDSGRIGQVITNLITNALRFTREGQIHVAVACVALRGTEANIRMSVTDSGVGIPREIIGTVFEKSGKAHESTSKIYGGRGIGLHLSRSLVALMGGQLIVESEVAKGSTFWFELILPIAAPLSGAQTAG